MLTYKNYYDKVFGSLLGKCVAGTIGAPYEGMKQLLNIKYEKSMIEKLLPNDDLDLQVLWLKVLEEKGVNFTSDDLAAAFSEYNVIWPGEYAIFDKNYRRGLRPPYTAKYENGFYNQGMGCPIRGEIWGLICPLNPELATKLCVYDGTLDHEGESVYFERFISAMISYAFEENDLLKLVLKAKQFVKRNSRAEKLINDVLHIYRSGKDALYLRDYLLTAYGHSDCTNSFINIGITVFCLLKGEKNVIDTVMTALNCGFDTDCTTGICGSVLGAIIGAENLILKEGFKDNGYKTMLNYQRKTDRISDLAADVCNMGLYFMEEHPYGVKCVEGESSVKIPKIAEKIVLSVDYPDGPFFEPDKKTRVYINALNAGTIKDGEFSVLFPKNFLCTFKVKKEIKNKVVFVVEIKYTGNVINEKNIFTAVIKRKNDEKRLNFGLVGKTPYKVFGPFWDNNLNVTFTDNKSHYSDYIGGDGEENKLDNLRFYHLNTTSDIDKEYLSVNDIEKEFGKLPSTIGKTVFFDGDEIDLTKKLNFNGDCVYYLKKTVIFDCEKTVNLQIGSNAPYKLYLNGKCLSCGHDAVNYTPERAHLFDVKINKGENVFIIKLRRITNDCRFSMNLLENEKNYPAHVVGLQYKVNQEG